jgi:hypothetical protein
MLYAPGTFTGNYAPQGDPLEADLISVHEFGVRADGEPSEINLALARFVLAALDERPDLQVVGTQATARALLEVSEGTVSAHHKVVGESADALGGGLGTWGELMKVRQVMEAQGLYRPLLVGQAYHIGRVGLQAIRAGITDFVVPPNSPDGFAPESSQIWTRNRFAWSARELVGAPVLRHQGKL